MPPRNAHLLQAWKNEQFFREFELATTAYRDWAVVALFYSAVHHVDAFLASVSDFIADQPPQRGQGHHPRRHEQRESKISNHPHLVQIYNPYRELRQRSEDARYRLLPFTEDQVKKLAAVEFEAVKRHLAR